jgi:hypothetical protein
MSYDPVITPRAAEDLAALPLHVQSFLEQQINRIAGNPSAMSRSAPFPYPPGQFSEFDYEFEGVKYHLTVHFRFGQDERTLVVYGIGRVKHSP